MTKNLNSVNSSVNDADYVHVLRDEVPELRLNAAFSRHCPVKLNNKTFIALLDSGNLCNNVINMQTLDKLGLSIQNDVEPIEDLPRLGTAKSGSSLIVKGIVRKPLKLQFGNHTSIFLTRPLVCSGLSMDLNISGPFMKKIKLDQLHAENCIQIQGRKIPLLKNSLPQIIKQSGVYLVKDVLIPPNSMKLLPVSLGSTVCPSAKMEGVILGHQEFAHKSNIIPVPSGVVTIENGETSVMAFNTDDEEHTVRKGTRYGTYCDLQFYDIVSGINKVQY